MKPSLKSCEAAMENAQSYPEWKEAALNHDYLSGKQDWKASRTHLFDYDLIAFRSRELRDARLNGRVDQLVFNLQESLHGNLGNIANPALYQQTKFGTNELIVQYLQEVTDSILFLKDCSSEFFDLQAKLKFFRNTGEAFGRSALLLSGGASLGLFHLGVVKSLWEERLLPTVISGSSAGSIMAAVLGSHNDAELEQIFDPEYLITEAFKLVDWRSLLRGRPLMDGDQLEACLEANIKDLTFDEAYEHTGRIINITVSPYDHHQKSRLLNMRTSPHVLIRKASLASCAIPGVFPPVSLWAKNIQGDHVPYIPTRKWVDGSIKDDLPITRLRRLYAVNHTIVSQTNPHVVPFVARADGGNGITNFAKQVINDNVALNLNYLMDVVRKYTPSNNFGLLLDKAQSVVRQKYSGDINIVPPSSSQNILKALANPDAKGIQAYIRAGQLATWPRIEMIRNTTLIGRTFDHCLTELERLESTELTRANIRIVPPPEKSA